MNQDAGVTRQIKVPHWEVVDFEILPFLRAPKIGNRLASENMDASIDKKISKLAALGLPPHPNLLSYRKDLVEQLENNGEYQLRWSSGNF